jgi:hypothetical protein
VLPDEMMLMPPPRRVPCLCWGKFAAAIVTVPVRVLLSAPPVVPGGDAEGEEPRTILNLVSGTLKVVVPLPTPKMVAMTENRWAYVERLTAVPSQNKYPGGAVEAAQRTRDPIGRPTATSGSLGFGATL